MCLFAALHVGHADGLAALTVTVGGPIVTLLTLRIVLSTVLDGRGIPAGLAIAFVSTGLNLAVSHGLFFRFGGRSSHPCGTRTA